MSSNANNTHNHRNNILNRLREAGTESTEPLERSEISIHDDWDTAELIRRFRERMEAVRAEIHQCEFDQLQELLVSICQKKSIESLLYSTDKNFAILVEKLSSTSNSPSLKTYNRDIEEWKEELFYQTDASITSTLGGIAETGTLILWPTTEEPRLMSLVPPIHIAILDVDKLYSTFAEVVRDQNWSSQMPTNALLISGPSKSADIEQTLAYGVHGPKELVVILIES